MLKTQDKQKRLDYNRNYRFTITKPNHIKERQEYLKKYNLNKKEKQIKFDRKKQIIFIGDKEYNYSAFSILEKTVKIYFNGLIKELNKYK